MYNLTFSLTQHNYCTKKFNKNCKLSTSYYLVTSPSDDTSWTFVYNTLPHGLKTMKGGITAAISTTDGNVLQGAWDGEDSGSICAMWHQVYIFNIWDYRDSDISLKISFNYIFTHSIVIECGRLNLAKVAVSFHMLFCNVNLPFLHQVVGVFLSSFGLDGFHSCFDQ